MNPCLPSGVPFVLAWLNVYAACYYFNYLFFQLRADHAFGNLQNLLAAAWSGLVYVPFSWYAGRFIEKRGCVASLRLGFAGMAFCLAAGPFLRSAWGQMAILSGWTVAICFTWPALEALASHADSRAAIARRVGLYNVTWSSGAAVAFFTAGALQQVLGRASLFWLPLVIHVTQLILLQSAQRGAVPVAKDVGGGTEEVEPKLEVTPDRARLFLRLAWVANPFAYVAMNTLIPLVPDLAARLGLSKSEAGFVGSVWMFARMGAFALLWHWTGWHYRFRWLMAAYAAMLFSFAAVFLVPSLTGVVLAQLVLGLSVGLIYYSSLFYSMDVGETKGAHCGYHETLIGAGIFAGPAIGAAVLQSGSTIAHIDIYAVAGVLVMGAVAVGAVFAAGRK